MTAPTFLFVWTAHDSQDCMVFGDDAPGLAAALQYAKDTTKKMDNDDDREMVMVKRVHNGQRVTQGETLWEWTPEYGALGVDLRDIPSGMKEAEVFSLLSAIGRLESVTFHYNEDTGALAYGSAFFLEEGMAAEALKALNGKHFTVKLIEA